jgi:hypothetical protein
MKPTKVRRADTDARRWKSTKKAAAKAPPDKRIYVLLPETVQVAHRIRGLKAPQMVSIHMEAGRLIAQGEHVVSKMRMEHYDLLGTGPITTINLSVRNSKELDKVWVELNRLDILVDVVSFFDTNEEFYGTKKPVCTAICTTPITQEESDSVVGHLELFKARGE